MEKKEINEHKNIKECAVIGLKDDFFGEIVFAVCVMKKQKRNFELNLRNFLSNRLANYQQPVGYSFVKELPVGPGVYKFKDLRKRSIYIGKAKNLKNRLKRVVHVPIL